MAELGGHGAGQGVDAGLGRRVCGGVGRHDLPGDRRDVDDAPAVALFDDGPPERAAHVEGAVEVRVDDGPPEVDVEVDHGHPVRTAGRARVVHDDVDAPEGAEHLT